jgi:hypothetical protein
MDTPIRTPPVFSLPQAWNHRFHDCVRDADCARMHAEIHFRPAWRTGRGRETQCGGERARDFPGGVDGVLGFEGLGGVSGALCAGRGQEGEMYAETSDEDVDFLLGVLRGVGG